MHKAPCRRIGNKNIQPPIPYRGQKTPFICTGAKGNTGLRQTSGAKGQNKQESDANVRVFKTRNNTLEELPAPVAGKSVPQEIGEISYKVYTTDTHRNADIADRPLTNKACSFAPESQDFAQWTRGSFNPSPNPAGSIHDQYKHLLLEQYGFDPLLPQTAKLLQRVLYDQSTKVENSSQCVNPDVITTHTDTMESPWQCVENVEDMDRYLELGSPRELQVSRQYNIQGQPKQFPSSTPTQLTPPHTLIHRNPKNIRISEVPRIKLIAEKYAKFKKMNIELRKLEEKIVCVEYDVFEEGDDSKPIQKMRAFFSVSSTCDKCEDLDIPLRAIPSGVRNKFNITEKELKDLNTKEIEIIDSTIPKNKTYLDDLKKVLRRKREICTKKNKPTLDLLSMYNMAKRDTPVLDYDFSSTNLLSKAELAEIREMILSRCASKAQGINKQYVKPQTPTLDLGQLSESILTAFV